MAAIGESTIVSFYYQGAEAMMSSTGALTFIDRLDRIDAVFENMVVARTVIVPERLPIMMLWRMEGSIPVSNFIQMMRFELGISTEDWKRHMDTHSTASPETPTASQQPSIVNQNGTK